MTPVKNQGGCASCVHFVGTTVLEARYAIKHGTTPVRLSEQEGVDCARRSNLYNDYERSPCCCGWMTFYWDFVVEHGASTYDQYPYEMKYGGYCRNQENKTM